MNQYKEKLIETIENYNGEDFVISKEYKDNLIMNQSGTYDYHYQMLTSGYTLNSSIRGIIEIDYDYMKRLIESNNARK